MCDKSSGSVRRVRVELDPELVGGRQVGGDGVAAEVAEDRALGAVAVDLNVVPVAVVALLNVELQKSEKDSSFDSLKTVNYFRIED